MKVIIIKYKISNNNYTNSNQREENRDEQSLFDEIENDNP